jgi:secondary thiamine-phosphate synthase enzyme
VEEPSLRLDRPITSPPLRQATTRIEVSTRPRALLDVTAVLDRWLAEIGAGEGLLTVFLRHTSASLTIQENASPEVLPDLVDALDRLAPRDRRWRHDLEGDDDMPAHVKTTLTGVSLAIPVLAGRMDLGTWQAVYVMEHRDTAHRRTATLHYLGS